MTVFAVDTHLLLQVVWVSLAAGVAISVLFSLVIVSSARSGDARREGRHGAATVFGVLATVAFVVFAAGVVLGVQAMITK